jgi:hypothetical protein
MGQTLKRLQEELKASEPIIGDKDQLLDERGRILS